MRLHGPGRGPHRLRIDKHSALKQNPLRRTDLDDFVDCCMPGRPHEEREESERFKAFDCKEIAGRAKADLDLTWLRDEFLEDLETLPSPDVLAREIVEDLTAALAEFEAVATALEEHLGTTEIDEEALTAD